MKCIPGRTAKHRFSPIYTSSLCPYMYILTHTHMYIRMHAYILIPPLQANSQTTQRSYVHAREVKGHFSKASPPSPHLSRLLSVTLSSSASPSSYHQPAFSLILSMYSAASFSLTSDTTKTPLFFLSFSLRNRENKQKRHGERSHLRRTERTSAYSPHMDPYVGCIHMHADAYLYMLV